MIIIENDIGETIPDRDVLIDADCVAYYGAYTCDDLPLRSATRRVDYRMNQIMEETRAETYQGFLTGKYNFREDIATLRRYKGNRYDKDGNRITNQPKWLPECREYLQKSWKCKLVHGEEADDALGIAQIKNHKNCIDSVISSIDKDLWIIEGLHHNMNSGLIEYSDYFGFINSYKSKLLGTGQKFFYAQLLMGDTADWIPGLPKVTEGMVENYGVRRGGCGAVAAFKTLESADTEEECLKRVWECYKEYWCNNDYNHWRTGELYKAGEETALKQLTEQGRLLWMRTKEGEMWQPKLEMLK